MNLGFHASTAASVGGPVLDLERFAAPPGRVETLAERGVYLPFTTPMLAGARLRRVVAAGGIGSEAEVILPHPTIRDGSFVLPWSSVTGEGRVHYADQLLVAELEGHPLDPQAVRHAALRIAGQGVHGRAARRAARELSDSVRRRAQALAALLETRHPGAARLAPLLLTCGIPGWPGGTLPPQQVRLVRLATQLAAHSQAAADPVERECAIAVARAATLAASAAYTLIQAGEAVGADPGMLLRAPPEALATATAVLARAAWAMDGFALLAALWERAGEADRPLALRLAVHLVPPVAAEMEAWPGFRRWELSPRTLLRRLPPRLAEGTIALWLAP